MVPCQGGTKPPGSIATQIMRRNTTNGGLALHPALMSPSKAITDWYLSHENDLNLQDIPATQVALILCYFQVFLHREV